MVCGIYYILNKVNGKIYIGQSVNLNQRLMRHKAELRGNYHPNEHLQNAWNYYGEDSFKFSLLEECDESDLDNLEIHYINLYDTTNRENGYNKDHGGVETRHHSLETRKKISEAKQNLSEETLKRMSEAQKGKKLSDETRKKISESLKGHEVSNETRKKLSNAHKGRTFSEETLKRMSEAKKGEKSVWYGKHHTLRSRRKMSESQKGHKVSVEARKKMSEAKKGKNNPNFGKQLSDEIRKKISEGRKGKRSGTEHQYFGKPRPEETRKKISEAQKGEKSYKWGTSIIEEWGGLWFLKIMIEAGFTSTKTAEYTGIPRSTITKYLNIRDYTWTKLKCIKDGKTQEDIAKEVGLTSSGIQHYLKRNGYDWASLKEKWGNINPSIDELGGLNFIINCIKDGKTQEDIAKELKTSHTTIRKYIKLKGYTWAQLKKEAGRNMRHSIIDEYGGVEFIKNCIKNGKSQENIAKDIGIARITLQSYLKNRGYSWEMLKKEVKSNNVTLNSNS